METVREGTRWDTSAEPRGEAAKKSVADCGLPYAHQERTPIPLDRDAADRRTCTHQPTPLRQPNPLASVPGGSGFTPLGYKKRQSLKKGKAGKGAQGGCLVARTSVPLRKRVGTQTLQGVRGSVGSAAQ